MQRSSVNSAVSVDRRQILRGTLSSAALLAMTGRGAQAAATVAEKGNINQSVVFWCFNAAGDKWDIEKTSQIAAGLGCKSVELVEPADWKTLEKYGLVCAIASNGMPGAPFMKGFNNPLYHEEVITRTKKSIDDCSAAGFPSVIAFTGYKWRDAEDPSSGEISAEEGADNCIAGLKKIAPYAEKKGVTICLEHLNTRDDSHPMKGHPGYQGDDLDEVAAMLRRVGSKNVKLLFDIYHVQVMNGDLIRRLEQTKDIVGHVHTAGCPGRGELDANQEIHYPAVLRKLLEINYEGYVGQEFIPTRDPVAGLTEAVKLCDV
jgi:hydroxypyruvate isomerase